jgi:hypothetical protein
VDNLKVKLRAVLDREKDWAKKCVHLKDDNVGLEYTLKQLKVKCEEYEKALKPKLSYHIHEPCETPSVRWVTYSNFLQCMNSLHKRLDIADKELEEYHVGGR